MTVTMQQDRLDQAVGRRQLAPLDQAVAAGNPARVAQELADLRTHYPDVPGGVLRLWPVPPNTGDAVERVRQLNQAVVEVVVAYGEQARQVGSTRDFTADGLARRRLALAQQALAAVEAKAAQLPALEGLAVSLAQAVAREVSKRPSDPAQALRDATIVKMLAELDPASRTATLEKAVREEDTEAVRAIVQAPNVLRLLTDADREHFAADLLRLSAPKLWAESEALRQGLAFTRQTINAATGYLDGVITATRHVLGLERS